MAMLMLLLLVTVTGFALLVLADSGVRMWQAYAKLRVGPAPVSPAPFAAMRQTGRVTTRISYARGSARQPMRAAA